MCSSTELTLNQIRIVKWEDLLLKERTGNVTDITVDCQEKLHKEIMRRLNEVEEKQQNTTQELSETKSDLKKELNEAKQNLTDMKTQQEKDKSKFQFEILVSFTFRYNIR